MAEKSKPAQSSKKWKTGITGHVDKSAYVRGYKLTDMVGKLTFSQSVFLLLKGELPTIEEAKMMDAILVSGIDHGIAPPSVTAVRTVFSGGNPLNTAVAAGVMTLGESHGGAIEQCARILQEEVSSGRSAADVISESLALKKRLPGFGHKYYTDDPRTIRMSEIAKELGLFGKHCDFAFELEKELEGQKGRKLCLNVDGMIAAIISDMDFDWKLGKGFFIIARTAGLVAHVHEEWVKEKPFRRLSDDEYEYTGVKPRSLP